MHYPELHQHFAETLPGMVGTVVPTHFPNAQVSYLNESAASELDLDTEWLRSDEGVAWMCGATGGVATAYAGHQFGAFVPLLGDGRATLLGDRNGYEIQLKGSGRTPFSRPGSDGKGPLTAMLREYLVSEHMHAIGVPTTRALAVISTGETVMRSSGPVPAGIVVRVARSHLRVGSVQYAGTQSHELLEAVVHAAGFDAAERLLEVVVDKQLELVAQWMRYGFVHGVMNTDNTALSGETIDYGPCAFTQGFDPHSCFSSIDRHGRYCFGAQPNVIAWNLVRLAEGLLPLMPESRANEILTTIPERWEGATKRWFGPEGLDAVVGVDDLAAYNRKHGVNGRPGPLYVPKNFALQDALDAVEHVGDYSPFTALLQAVTHPYDPDAGEPWMLEKEPDGAFTTFCGT